MSADHVSSRFACRRLTACLLFFTVFVLSASPYVETAVADAEKLILKKKYREAAKIAEEASAQTTENTKDAANLRVLLARCKNLNREYQSAAEILDQMKMRPDHWHLEKARSYFGMRNYDAVLECTKYYEMDRSINAVHLLTPANWLSAQAQMKLKKYRLCMNTCGKIILLNLKDTPAVFSDYKLSEAFMKELARIQQKAGKLYYDAREAYDIQTYGRDFALYRKAREAQYDGNYAKAREFYDEIADGTLKEAAACYAGECHILEGDNKKALDIFEARIKENPHGLYRGEMLYQKAVVEFLDGKYPKALNTIKTLRKWCGEVASVNLQATENSSVGLAGINDALQNEIIRTAPKSFLKLDDCGNLIATAKYPETINNRLTSPWYLPHLTVRAELFYAFLLSLKNTDAAVISAIFEKACTMTSMQIIRDKHTVGNLKASLEMKSYLVPEKIMKGVKKFENHLSLACFFYLSDNRSEAEKLFDYVMRHAPVNTLPLDAALARLGKIYSLIERNQTTEAIKLADNTTGNQSLSKTPVNGEIRYLKACILAKSPSTFTAALNEFKEIANSSTEIRLTGKDNGKNKKREKRKRVSSRERGQIAPKALLAAAAAAVNAGEINLALKFCREISMKYGRHPYSRPAATLAMAIEGDRGAGNKNFPVGVVAGASGRVILHRRIVVTPGAAQWINPEAEVKTGDIILFRVKFIPRSDCTIIRGVWVNLNAGEPSPPDAAGNEICFVRIPALYQLNLTVGNGGPGV